MSNERETRLCNQITNFVKSQGVEVFGVTFGKLRGVVLIRVYVDFTEGGITLSDCSEINRKLSEYLGKDVLPEEEYSLEVSSPGADRYLYSVKDFRRVKGRCVEMWLTEEYEGKTQHLGEVTEVDSDRESVFIETGGRLISIPIQIVKKAKQKVA